MQKTISIVLKSSAKIISYIIKWTLFGIFLWILWAIFLRKNGTELWVGNYLLHIFVIIVLLIGFPILYLIFSQKQGIRIQLQKLLTDHSDQLVEFILTRALERAQKKDTNIYTKIQNNPKILSETLINFGAQLPAMWFAMKRIIRFFLNKIDFPAIEEKLLSLPKDEKSTPEALTPNLKSLLVEQIQSQLEIQNATMRILVVLHASTFFASKYFLL